MSLFKVNFDAVTTSKIIQKVKATTIITKLVAHFVVTNSISIKFTLTLFAYSINRSNVRAAEAKSFRPHSYTFCVVENYTTGHFCAT